MKVSDIIVEAFTTPYAVDWEHDIRSHDALVTLPDGTDLTIMFTLDDSRTDTWEVEFHRGLSQDITGQGDAYRVFATVLDAMQQFIDTRKPNVLQFTATNTDDSGEENLSRSKLYTRLVDRYARKWGYNVDTAADWGEKIFYRLKRMS
jgi:hypothetical protein